MVVRPSPVDSFEVIVDEAENYGAGVEAGG